MRYEDHETLTLVHAFENAISEGRQPYFDVEDLELILDYYLDTGSYEQTKNALEIAQAIHPLAFTFKIKEVQLDIAMKDFSRAEAKLNHLEGLNMRSTELLIARATILMHRGNTQKGLQLLDEALANSEDPVEVLQMIADTHLSQGDYPRAINILVRLCRLEDENLDEGALYQLAMCLDFTNEYDRAIALFESFTSKEPYNPLLWYQLGSFQLRKDNEAVALEMFQWAITADETFHAAYFEKGRIHERNEEYINALTAYKQSINEDLPSGYVHFRIGLLEAELGSPNEALRQFNKAIALEPDMDDVHLERASVLMELERYTEAIKDYKKVWLKEAYGSEDVLDFVECLIELDLLDQAIAILQDAVERFPEVLQFRLVLAGYLFAADDIVSAKSVLDDVHLNRDELRTLFAEYFPDLLEVPVVAAILAELK